MRKFMILFVTLIFLAGCGSTIKDPDACSNGFHKENGICVEDKEIRDTGSFESSDDVLDLFVSFRERSNLVSGMWRGGWMMFAMAETDDVAEDASNDADKGSDDYSGTNNQVEGVDEMDNVLTDGKYIYIQNYNKIQVVLAYTMNDGYDVLNIVKEIDIDDLADEDGNYFYFNGMYVDDERLIIVGTQYYNECQEYYEDKDQEENPDGSSDEDYRYCKYYEYHSMTTVLVYDKEDFELQETFELSGYYVGSRKIGDDLYFVTNEWVPFYMMENEEYDFNLDNYLPRYKVNDTLVELDYDDILYVEGTEPSTFTSFFGINLDTNEVSTEVVLGEGGYNLYVSTENIYLTGTKWNWNWDMMAILEDAAENDEEVDEDDLEEEPYEISTSIIKVSIDDGKVDFEASGDVPGIALDQFAMSEKDGYVRIVTTGANWWFWWGAEQPEINNRLMVLDEDLEIVSMLEGLGKEGETVQSTRFVGDYAYVVTFLRTDPFYVIDLSDPLNPQKLSELEIPGFSDYLQPIGEDYILGIGYGDNDGGTNGIKISLYDVSDKSNAVVASEIIYPHGENSYMWTSTVYNHKDLLVSIDKGIIALPYTQHNWSNVDGYRWRYHTGILVLNLDVENGLISERGRVEHSEANTYDIYVHKSKFISDFLYTISSKYIKVSTIEDPETVLSQIQIGESREIYYNGVVEEDAPEGD